ncbi:acetylxylan esterase [Occultella gossypii]|uniref:Acetylxylan esterase n=1 Tax=Occultella gossypii TaxID=2800820 RepID=A0ABS7S7R5_9MICO|nr:acetylxylan esterase [Occultella gossypii]MBZ2196401.1 acetylxylan esterase [Occultella gossypii]
MATNSLPSAIGDYEDWPEYVRASAATPASEAAESPLASVLRPPARDADPRVTFGRERVLDGVRISPLTWQLGYGPPTAAHFLRPEKSRGPLPAVLLMHCHSGNKWLGAERLVDLGAEDSPEARALRSSMYEGQAIANLLAARGFAVLAHDTFAWGSRRFRLDPTPARTARHLHGWQARWQADGIEATEEMVYNAAAADHENTVAKVAGLLGTSFAGMVAHDDLAALDVLRGLPDVDPERIGTLGASGGGGRAMMLASLSGHVRAHLVCCMMATFDSLLPAYLDGHSWLMYTPGIWALSDWPLIPLHAPAPQAMHVQFAAHDRLFPLDGMREADALLQAHRSERLRYSSSWFDSDHAMTRAMQHEAADFLAASL